MKIALVKTDKGFIPAFESDYETAKKIAIGEIREYETKRNRSLGHHRKFFALLRITLHLLPEQKHKEAFDFGFSFITEDDVLFYIKMKLGLYKERMILKNGKVAIIPDSISFSSMKQDEFQDFYNKSFDIILNLLDADRDMIENELIGFM